jgi:CRP-like cAMP-binding protein
VSQVNRLLAMLPRDAHQRLLAGGQRVRVPHRTCLCEMGDAFAHAYFPLSGLASLLATTEEGETVEVATVGAEGMIGLPLLTGSAVAPYSVAVRLSMDAVRISASTLAAELSQAPILRHVLSQYVHAVVAQTAQTAVCYRFHTGRQRLCRWLLAARDHAQADLIPITQDILGRTLGLSRTAISALAVDLQDRGVISCRHGRIRIRDRRALEVLTCECYRLLRDEAVTALSAASR